MNGNKLGRMEKVEKETQTDVQTLSCNFTGTDLHRTSHYIINKTVRESQLTLPIIAVFLTAVRNLNVSAAEEEHEPNLTLPSPEEDVESNNLTLPAPEEDQPVITDGPRGEVPLIQLDSSDGSSDEDGENGSDGENGTEDEQPVCAVCAEREPDVYLRRCRHAFCHEDLDEMKRFKTRLWRPKCKKNFRSYVKIDEEWVFGTGRRKNHCCKCNSRRINAVLKCRHTFCSTCLDELLSSETTPKCPMFNCTTKFRTYSKLYY